MFDRFSPHFSDTISSRASWTLSDVWFEYKAEHPKHQDCVSRDSVIYWNVIAMFASAALLVQMAVVQAKEGWCASSASITFLVSVYSFGISLYMNKFLRGMSYFLSSCCTRFRNPLFSTVYIGTWSRQINSATALFLIFWVFIVLSVAIKQSWKGRLPQLAGCRLCLHLFVCLYGVGGRDG